jgi:hypothetical protein
MPYQLDFRPAVFIPGSESERDEKTDTDGRGLTEWCISFFAGRLIRAPQFKGDGSWPATA